MSTNRRNNLVQGRGFLPDAEGEARREARPQALMLALAVLAALATPVPKSGQCPSGYRESGGYCAPLNRHAPPAIPKHGQCPSGWRQSAHYCVRMACCM
jgi:hypothetical protein